MAIEQLKINYKVQK